MRLSLYLDTSCLVKELLSEPESPRVLALVAAEARVIVSSLGRLEARIALEALLVGGAVKRRQALKLTAELDRVLAAPPHEVLRLPADAVDLALAQIGAPGSTRYCRAADRLHLGAMQAFGLRRLLTNDAAQADAARALGFDVIIP